jgi:hypothetical protein
LIGLTELACKTHKGGEMKKLFLTGLALGTILFTNTGAIADVIFDQSFSSEGDYQAAPPNIFTDSYFTDQVSFISGATITGMDIYWWTGDTVLPTIGQSVIVNLSQFDAGATLPTLINTVTTTISIIDTEGAFWPYINRVHVDISSPLILMPGIDYLIGLLARNGA